jgi:hypothetical protein
MVGEVFDPLRAELDAREDAEFLDHLAGPISPRGTTGWAAVDETISEMRRHFSAAQTGRDYSNVGADAVAVLEALSAAAYDRARHLPEGEDEPPIASTKNRLGRVVEVDFPGEGSTELVSLAKRAIEFAQAVKHNAESNRKRAGVAADSVILLSHLIRRVVEPDS